MMEQETQILLERLIEAVNAPDWWSVVATIIAAIVAMCITCKLGKRQNELQQQQLKLQEQQNKIQEYQTKLQEQQTRQQEYDTYRGLYGLVFSIHKASNGIVMKIYSKLASGGKVEMWTWNDIRKEISTLKSQMEDKTIDIELKFPEDSYLCESYKLLFALMDGAINKIESIENQGFINIPMIDNMKTIISNVNKGNNHMIELIASYITDKKAKEEFISTLQTISNLHKMVCDSNFLNKIKDKI